MNLKVRAWVRIIGLKHKIILFLSLILLLTIGFTGCSKQTLTTSEVQRLIEAQIGKSEYCCLISTGEKIGAIAGEPEKFLKQLGLANYIIREQNHTWYVVTSLTESGQKNFRPVNTIWGPRYAATVAKLKVDKISGLNFSRDKCSAVAEVTLHLERMKSVVGQNLDPEKSVFENHNIYIQCVEVDTMEESPWHQSPGLPYKVQFVKRSDGWHFAKILD